MSTLLDKIGISLRSAAVFAVVGMPQVYKITNNVFPGTVDVTGCPTFVGLIVHTIVFYLISFATMWLAPGTVNTKAWNSLQAAGLYAALNNSWTYRFTDRNIGQQIGLRLADSRGCPTLTGVIVHALVYAAILVGLMYL